jgi:amidase
VRSPCTVSDTPSDRLQGDRSAYRAHSDVRDSYDCIRTPHRSVYNGLYGLRPTMRRLPYLGARNFLAGMEAIESVLGPMARSLGSCVTFMRAVLAARPHDLDPTVVPMPWREDLYRLEGRREKLCFGLLLSDDAVAPHPPIRRGLEMTRRALEMAGHEGAHCSCSLVHVFLDCAHSR